MKRTICKTGIEWGKVAALVVTAFAGTVNADTIEIDGVAWTYSGRDDTTKTVTLGGNGSSTSNPQQAMSTSASIAARPLSSLGTSGKAIAAEWKI